MPTPTTYGLFVAAALALLLVPGPAVFYIVARGVEGGRRAGLVSSLGIEIGTLMHAAFAAVGLSAVIASSAAAFTVVKWLGAVYLVYLGLKRLFGEGEGAVAVGREPPGRVLVQGVLVQVLNPKVALFFLAFLPQFVDPSRGPVWAQILLLGATLGVLGLVTDGLYALLGGTAADWLRRRDEMPRLHRAGRYLSGGVYLALGAAAATTGSGKD